MQFSLRKFYFDCVSPGGDAWIGYSARLSWGGVGFNYGAELTHLYGRRTEERQTCGAGRVAIAANGLEWTNSRLKVSGAWRGDTGPEPVRLYADRHGEILWQCLRPAAAAHIQSNPGRELVGAGYAECLTMTLPPWRLPMHTLRWGRFISDDLARWRVWIDWRGGETRSWIWGDERAMRPERIDDDQVASADELLTFEAPRATLRSERLAESLFGRAHRVARLLPRKLAEAHETKWLSRGTLRTHEGIFTGWVIHEVVAWG